MGRDTNIREDLYIDLGKKLSTSKTIDYGEPVPEELPLPTDTRTRTLPVKTIHEFYRLFQQVITVAETEDGKSYSLRLVEEYPPDETLLPCYTISLVSRVPFGSRSSGQEFVPRYIESRGSREFSGTGTHVYNQRYENVLEIGVWAKTNKVANSLSEWLEEKFFQYLWVFEYGGFTQPIRYLGRNEDTSRLVKNQRVHVRPLRFLVITSRITERDETIVRKLAMKYNITTDSGDTASS
jgi:hypothetical protein